MGKNLLVTPEGLIDHDWYEIKIRRNELLKETDWTQVEDVPLSAEQRAEYSEYRKALRDLPQTFDDPIDIVWPTTPTN
ncbi:tail fiber assembly protein [Veronia pacifica]|uniref:Phage tail assembly chaperone-like domain-containing protein n=1 Tax=Veronia pacifica TaxID=1080227 RepID=A0A1C3EBM4_9GAMM|nr:tail fiber assembly protein [Veronia pacifica]ODA30628.1 hypothetical protein A8L45_19685 [Veronia pacifica]